MGDKPIQPDTINTMLNGPIFLPPANEVCEGYVFTRVCVHTGGGSTWAGTPRTRYTPPGQVHHPPDQVNPPGQVHPPGPGTHTAGPGTPSGRYTPRAGTPSGSSACWEIRATSGRYASYWNAFLLIIIWS